MTYKTVKVCGNNNIRLKNNRILTFIFKSGNSMFYKIKEFLVAKFYKIKKKLFLGRLEKKRKREHVYKEKFFL